MATSAVVTNLRAAVLDLAERTSIKRRLSRYREESRAHRKLIASERAYKEMQQRKDQAIIDVYRHGFAR
jgi:hypothetical protein